MENKSNRSILRLSLLKSQLISNQKHTIINDQIEEYKNKSKIDIPALQNLYYPLGREIISFVNESMKRRPDLFPNKIYELESSINQQKELAAKQMVYLIKDINDKYPGKFKGVRENMAQHFLFLFALGIYDSGLSVKLAVHSMLYYSSIQHLSSNTSIHKGFLERATTLEDIGCFALTEFAHGSNVREIKTKVVYDQLTKEFILNNECKDSYKWWIGKNLYKFLFYNR